MTTDRDQLQERAAVVAEAVSWKDTPFVWWANVKGKNGGVDCAHFPDSVYLASGIPYGGARFPEPGELQPDWHLHSKVEWYLNEVTHLFGQPFEAERLEPGDMILSKMGRAYCHGAIVIEWPKIIHTHPTAYKVTISDVLVDCLFAGRELKFFSPWSKNAGR